MLYKSRYDKLINYYKHNLPEGYVEKHHIIPKCLGGNNSIDNLILLPTRAHFIVHYLLYKAYPENKKLAHAFAMMSVCNKFQVRSSKLYEKSKIARSSALKGVPRPEWVKQKLRKPKNNKENYKKPKSESHAKNISNSLKGKKKNPNTIKKIVESSKNYYEYRKQLTNQKIEYYKKLYIETNVTRKEFYKLHPEINLNTLKRYLKGI